MRITSAAAGFPVRMPVARDGFEGLTRGLPFGRGIDGGEELLARVLVALPRKRERHFRVNAQRERFLLAAEAVVVAPITAAVRGDVQVKATAVGELLRAVEGLDGAQLGISEHLLVSAHLPWRYQQTYHQRAETSLSAVRWLEKLTY